MNQSKATRLSLVLCAAMCATPTAAPAADATRPGAVVVLASGRNVDGIGAGTIVARAGSTIRVITAKHVATFGTLTVRFFDGSAVPAHIVELIAGRDLAIVEADLPLELAALVRPVRVSLPQSNGAVHVWGSGYSGPAVEPAAVRSVGAHLPDGPSRGRFALACSLCRAGDSGGGVIDGSGSLVGVFVGYFTVATERIPVAEVPDVAVRTACERPFASKTVARIDPSATVPVPDRTAGDAGEWSPGFTQAIAAKSNDAPSAANSGATPVDLSK